MNLIGQSIGRYHILEQIGQGGMAIVYKAYDTRLERDVAVKIIRVEQFGQAAIEIILKRFEREAKSLARLIHPNIIRINDYGEHEGVPYLVMDYLPGGTIKERMHLPMSWETATRLLLPVSNALEYAHAHKIIHRDIKPANILLTENGHPMLTDFGIAKILETESGQTLTGTGVGIGTPEYMAPEQAMGNSVDARADIYSLGIVFYELVTGRKPYTADTPMAVIFKHLSDPLPNPQQFASDLPEAVEKILLKALAKKPEDRYESMGAFCKALEALLTSAQPDSKPVFVSMGEKVTGDANLSMSPKQTVISEMETINDLKVEASISAPVVAPNEPASVDVQKISAPERAQPIQQRRSRAIWVGLGLAGIALLGWLANGGAAVIFPVIMPLNTPTQPSQETPIVTTTPLATLTPVPQPTQTPTAIPPTPTVEPPSQLTNFFEDTRLTYFEGFDLAPLKQWMVSPCQTVNNGELEYACTDGWFGREYSLPLHTGEGILIDFKHINQTDDYYWSINLSSGEYGKNNWKIFGISTDQKYGQGINLMKATSWYGFPTRWVKSDVWYRLALAIGDNGKIIIIVWERDKPDPQVWKYRNTMGKDWSDLEWHFWINNTKNVTLNLDNYYQFAFSMIK